MSIPDIIAAFFCAAVPDPEPAAELDYYGPCDRAEPEPEAEL